MGEHPKAFMESRTADGRTVRQTLGQATGPKEGQADGRTDFCPSPGVATIAAIAAMRTRSLPNHALTHVGDTMDH